MWRSTLRCSRGLSAPYRASRTVSEQLDASAYDRNRLLGVQVTHSHLGSRERPRRAARARLDQLAELRYAAEDPDGKVFRDVSPGLEIHEYALDGPAYLGFPTSFDVHRDGSLVVALAGGHTLGSVVVFVTLPTGVRYAFIGDLT